MENNWLTSHEVADLAGIPYAYLWTYRKRGTFPEPDQYIGNKPLWSKKTVEEWNFNPYNARKEEQ